MGKAPLKDRVNYRLDNLFSHGPGMMILALAVASLLIVTLAAIVLSLTGFAQNGDTAMSFGEAFWEALMRSLDAGTMGGDTGWGFRLVMFVFPTLGGVFIISALIGVLSTGIDSKLESLRRGRSRVLESNHTIILGWTDQIFTIVPELVRANDNQGKSCVVILGPEDKIVMEEQLAEKTPARRRTRIVCRSGSPVEMADLNIVSLNTARSIIILSPNSAEPDAEVLKTVLAITNHPGRREKPYHIVAELRDRKNQDIARVVGKSEVEWVQVGDVVARVIAQTCRQSGLSVVYNELLDFEGDEIYFFPVGSLAGQTFGDILTRFEKNVVLGYRPAGGAPRLNPPMDTRLGEQDHLIVIAEDDDRIFIDGQQPAPIRTGAFSTGVPHGDAPERTLILGWNWRGQGILRELDNYVASGSETLVVADQNDVDADIKSCCSDLQNQTIRFQPGETTDRRTLDSLDLSHFQHIIILCYSDTMEVQQADSRTLVTLLHLRDVAEKEGKTFSIVSEMLDVRNRNLADVARADDFIVSDRMISLLMAQVSENKDLNAVFTDLFDPDGSEIYLKSAVEYVRPGTAVNFYTVVESARRRGEVAIGYRISACAHDASKTYGVVVNPAKSAEVTFAPEDRIIVLAEE